MSYHDDEIERRLRIARDFFREILGLPREPSSAAVQTAEPVHIGDTAEMCLHCGSARPLCGCGGHT